MRDIPSYILKALIRLSKLHDDKAMVIIRGLWEDDPDAANRIRKLIDIVGDEDINYRPVKNKTRK